MKIIVSALHFEWQDLRRGLLTATEDLGIHGVELSWHSSFKHPHCTREDLGSLAAQKRDTTLTAHIWEDLLQTEPEDALNTLRSWLATCKETDVTELVMHGGTASDQEEGIARMRAILERALPAFERAGVVLNLENHYPYHYHECNELFSEPWEFADVLSLDSPSLRFCLDTGHANMSGNTRTLIRELAPWLHYVHLADNHGVDDTHEMYRQGTVPWDDIFTQLHNVGFDGTFCVEFPVREDQQPFRDCLRAIRTRWASTAGEHQE
jgi:sugar phosphate isomerase/epimerase